MERDASDLLAFVEGSKALPAPLLILVCLSPLSAKSFGDWKSV